MLDCIPYIGYNTVIEFLQRNEVVLYDIAFAIVSLRIP